MPHHAGMTVTAPTQHRTDWRTTAAVGGALVLQAIAALLWVGSAAHRLQVVETRLDASATVSERLVRLEAEMIAVRSMLDRIDDRLSNGDSQQ